MCWEVASVVCELLEELVGLSGDYGVCEFRFHDGVVLYYGGFSPF